MPGGDVIGDVQAGTDRISLIVLSAVTNAQLSAADFLFG
jgi:hypothetical protein